MYIVHAALMQSNVVQYSQSSPHDSAVHSVQSTRTCSLLSSVRRPWTRRTRLLGALQRKWRLKRS